MFSPWQETGIHVNKDFDTCIKVTLEISEVDPIDSLIEQFEYNTESIYIRGIWGGIVNGGRKLTLSSCYKAEFGFYHSLQIAKLDSIHGVEWTQVERFLDNQ